MRALLNDGVCGGLELAVDDMIIEERIVDFLWKKLFNAIFEKEESCRRI